MNSSSSVVYLNENDLNTDSMTMASKKPYIMYIRRADMSTRPEQMQRICEAKALLLDRGVSSESLGIIDVSYEFELSNRIQLETNGKGEWPIFYVNGLPIGSLAALKQRVACGSLEDALRATTTEKQIIDKELERAIRLKRDREVAQLKEETEALEMRLTQIYDRMTLQKHHDQLKEEDEKHRKFASSSAASTTTTSSHNDDNQRQSYSTPEFFSPPDPPPRNHVTSDYSTDDDDDDFVQVQVSPDLKEGGACLDEGQTPETLSLGMISSALIPVEHAVQAVSSLGSMVGSYIWQTSDDTKNEISSSSTSSTTSTTSTSSTPTNLSSNSSQLQKSIDFQVIRTNWYYRRQIRILRFGATSYFRIDPSNNQVKEEFPYVNIAQVKIQSPTSFVIVFLNNSFSEGHSPSEYYECLQMQELLDLLKTRSERNCHWQIVFTTDD